MRQIWEEARLTEAKPPRLKGLELQGYKTFASKNVFQFAPTVTAVIGPNGSGKSNIADSIRWVLGEQSYSLLRGKKTEDMIFAGSDTRPRASMAAATVTFDNTDGWLPIDFTEVTISRRAYRDGQNEYLLNGQRVRLRDVSELLANSGLAQRTYTIIGQGLVDAALSLKAEERRRLFEEAAGIGLYRARREESLRRLDTTRRNLERVKDILAELRPRLRSLERQMKRADTYEQVKSDLNSALQVWYGYYWYQQMDVVKNVRREASAQVRERNALRAKQEAAEGELIQLRGEIASRRASLRDLSDEVSAIYAERESLGRAVAVSEERLRGLKDQRAIIQAELDSAKAAVEEQQQRLTSLDAQLQNRIQSHKDAGQARDALRVAGQVTSDERDERRVRVAELRRDVETAAGKMVKAETHLAQVQENIAAIGERLTELDPRLQESIRSEQAAQATLEATQAEAEKITASLTKAQQALNDHRNTLVRLEKDIRSAEKEQGSLFRRKADLETRLQVLTNRSDEASRSKAMYSAAKSGKIAGVEGRLREALDIPREYQVAVAAALGEFAESLAFQDAALLDLALDWMEREKADAQAALVPLESNRKPAVLRAPSGEGMRGNAADLVGAEAAHKDVAARMLGQVWIVTDRAAARRWLPDLPLEGRIVTLAGDVFYATGQVLAGAGAAEKSTQQAMERVERELNEVTASLKDVDAGVEKMRGDVQTTATAIETARQALETLQTNERAAGLQKKQEELAYRDASRIRRTIEADADRIRKELAQLTQREVQLKDEAAAAKSYVDTRRKSLEKAIDAAEKAEPSLEMARAEARLEVARQGLEEAERQKQESTLRLDTLLRDRSAWEKRFTANQAEGELLKSKIAEAQAGLDTFDSKLEEVKQRTEPVERSLREAEQKRTTFEQSEGGARAELQTAERKHSHLQIELARREEELASLKRRIEDDFGLVEYDPDEDHSHQDPLPLGELVQRLPRVHELPEKAEEQLQSLRLQLRRMGAINPEARGEFREVSQRVEFLTTQIEDLDQAESQLQEVIAELDMLMERELRRTFEDVAVAFKETFTRLFGGGAARLTLTDPDDLTISGIDIEARLPGRREQGLSMLSGGERSLTACALVFALLKVSPTPFCLLDEVDAMLDETNVGRFTDLLHELSQETQFVVITHNRQTVQTADVVYGISMGADSASRVISLKLDEAELEIMKE